MRIVAVATEYRPNSHAHMIVGRLLGEFTDYTPQVKVAALYLDQYPANDTGRETAARLGIPLLGDIREAIGHAERSGGVHGVVIIGEHGDYPLDEWGRKQYPRYRFMQEVLDALAELNVRVPIFSDKFLSYRVDQSVRMFEMLRDGGIPFMGGSSIPLAPRRDMPASHHLASAREWLVVSFSSELEAYGYHALEVLQSLAERRAGGEQGIAGIEALQGDAVWEAMDRRQWPEPLLLAALKPVRAADAPHPRASADRTYLLTVHYRDGSRGYVIQQTGLAEQWSFAFRDGRGDVFESVCLSDNEWPFRHFDRMTQMLEQFMMTGIPPFPAERILVSSCLINRAMEALHTGRFIATPELEIYYDRRCADDE
ncbi:hypothetical protein PA598K_02678 [Paenibacillus sp. 598K]|uniref:hypothetical protein n=1 Tax=Paenibacillus sp. 598K TaxID=1117987 RepID=UPI000FFAD5EF|nr:hypothetical protein [Paenibacillus sp. 598K]GBF74340.1 hypothetical protein PA598K_02678 [Paenibacillus sp. 598K]